MNDSGIWGSMIERLDQDGMRVWAPAKINLYLSVIGKRSDGYHELNSLMCPISLFDRMEITRNRSGIGMTCSGTQEVPENDDNLAWRAADTFLRRHPGGRGVHIRLEKRIPVAAGLGGGSSDAAAVLTALNNYYGDPFSLENLQEMGLSLGADIPFFLYGRPAWVSGRGETIEPIENMESFEVVLIAFGFGVSTAWVYKNLNLGLTKCKKINKSFPLKELGLDGEAFLCNDLETVTLTHHPEVTEAKKVLLDHGARGALMSGSGPTVFGLFSDPNRAKKSLESLTEHDAWKPYLVKMITR